MIKLEPTKNRDSVSHITFCSLPYTKLILNSYGDVSMCCHQLTQLGRINKDTNILDIWNSPLAKEIRQKTNQGELHHVCTSWNSCPFIVKERTPFPTSIHPKAAYPLYLEICLPDKHCNVGGERPTLENPACIMCKRNFNTPEQEDITDFLCEKSKPLMPYLKDLCVLGTAEPFWKDAVFGILEKLEFHRYKHQIRFLTNTNGLCLNERMTRLFFETVGISEISWSMDAASPETHQAIRRLDTFDLVVANIKRWIEMREEYGGFKAHKVCVFNNINLINIHEMTKMVELSHELKVDQMIMIPTYDQSGMVPLGEILLNQKNVKLFKKSSEKAMARAKELGVNLRYPNRFDVVPPSMKELNPPILPNEPVESVCLPPQALVQLEIPQ